MLVNSGCRFQVIGEKDADGFYKGEIQGRQGLVPCNLVSEVKDEATIRKVLGNEAVLDRPRHSAMKESKSVGHGQLNARQHDRPPLGPARKMVAIYDYDSKSASPNIDVEVSCITV